MMLLEVFGHEALHARVAGAEPAHYFVGSTVGSTGEHLPWYPCKHPSWLDLELPAMGPRHATLFLLAGIALLSGCTMYAQRPVKSFADATGGEGFERALWLDVKNKDWKDLQLRFASNFTYATPAASGDRTAALAAFQQMDVKEFSIADLQTQLNGNAFVVSYTISLRGTSAGQPLPERPQRRITVWQQQGSSWVAIAHAIQGSL
jgi:hypothetical protein